MSIPANSYLVSIIIPCYNEEEIINETILRINATCDDLKDYRFELIFVDDGSQDRTLSILETTVQSRHQTRILSFSRNFGHQLAVTAGVDAANGSAVIIIDADLQDPPELIRDMLGQWRIGNDVVYGVRRTREGESAFKIASARQFYRLLNHLSDIPIPLDTGDFRLMDRKVVDVLKSMPERHRFVRGMVAWAGFRQTALFYDRKKRSAGASKYPLRKMIRFATDGVLSFSSKPLQISINLGLIAASVALLGIVYAIMMRVLTSTWVEGWTALMIAILFMGGVQLVSLGIIGEYVGRIHEEAKRRPLYVVHRRIGFGEETQSASTDREQ